MRHLIITGLVLCMLFIVNHGTSAQATGPQAGDLSVVIKFGKAISFSDLNASEIYRSGQLNYNNTLPTWQMPSSADYSTEYSVTNMIGAEIMYFLPTNIAFRVSGGGSIQFNGSYANMELFEGFAGLDSNSEGVPTKDTRKGEAFAWGGSLVGGADYYIAEGFFIGIEIKAFNYMYAGKKLYPQSGMAPQTAENHNWMFLSQPSLKLGFSL